MAFKADLKSVFTSNLDGPTQLRVINAFCNHFNYQGANTNAAKADFTADRFIQIIKDIVRNDEFQNARNAVPRPVEIVID